MQCDGTKNDDDEWRAVRHQAAAASPFFGSGWRMAIIKGISFTSLVHGAQNRRARRAPQGELARAMKKQN